MFLLENPTEILFLAKTTEYQINSILRTCSSTLIDLKSNKFLKEELLLKDHLIS